MITRTVRRQLTAMSVATVAGALILATTYLRVPEYAGLGQYTVDVSFERGAQLYDGAEVTYRGSPVGRVTDMSIADAGINVELSLRDSIAVPTNVRAEIHSRSAVGEQYVDLVPRTGARTTAVLGDGDSIAVEATRLPVETGPLLDNVDALVASLPTGDLNALLAETSTALEGRGGDVARLIETAERFMGTATDNLPQTRTLIEDLEPLAAAVNSRDSELVASARNLADVASTLEAADDDLRALLQATPGFAARTRALLDELSGPLPTVLRSLGVITETAATYNDSWRDLLSTYPNLVAVIQSITVPHEQTNQIALDLANLNDPPACLSGFVAPDDWRDPVDQSTTETPRVYCDVPNTDARVVRGARNIPCVRYPGVRAATIQECRAEGER